MKLVCLSSVAVSISLTFSGCGHLRSSKAAPAPVSNVSTAQPSGVELLEVDFGLMTRPFERNGAVDQALLQRYWDAVAVPNPYLSENIGLHILKEVSKETVLRDFVPSHAAVLKDSGNTLELLLRGTYIVTFHFNKSLSIPGHGVGPKGFSYAWVGGPTVDKLIEGVSAFQDVIMREGQRERYYIRNDLYRLELETQAMQNANQAQLVPTSDANLSGFRAHANAVLLVPDLHGNLPRFEQFMSVLRNETFDWLGVEMASTSLQPVIDQYLSSAVGTPRFNSAKEQLLKGIWGDRFDPTRGQSESNLYYQIFKVAKERAIPVRALDSDEMYTFFGHGETPFGAAVRNNIWAASVPSRGKGVIFGGSAHMTAPDAVNVQDFLVARYPSAKFFLTVPRQVSE